MAAVNFNLAPQKALEFFRAKGLRESFAWQDMQHDEHDRDFTVAKMLDLDLLYDTQRFVDRGLAEGWSMQRFANAFKPELVRRGWWGRAEMRDPATGELREVQLGSPRRLKIIYDTNLRTAYAAGHWARIRENAVAAPYVMYHAILDERTRPMHRAWHGTVLRWDDPWWQTHSPPNGWNCRCTVIQFSERDLNKMGKAGPDAAPESPIRDWANPRTGEVVQVPVGVDPGWGYAPGASRMADLTPVALEKIAGAPAELGAAAFASISPQVLPALESEWAAWIDAVVAAGVARREWQIAGAAAPEEIAALGRYGVTPATAEIAFQDGLIVGSKALRHEQAGDALTIAEWKSIPRQLAETPLVLIDTEQKTLVYVLDSLTDPRKIKIAIEPDFQVKKPPRTLNAARSAYKRPASDIEGWIKCGRYVVVRGEL